jgi:hypothetical protein
MLSESSVFNLPQALRRSLPPGEVVSKQEQVLKFANLLTTALQNRRIIRPLR